MATKLDQKREERDTKQDRLAKAFELAGEDYDFQNSDVLKHLDVKDSAEAVKRVREWNAELETVATEVKELEEVAGIRQKVRDVQTEPADPPPHPGAGPEGAAPKTLGQLITESKAWKDYKATGSPSKSTDVHFPLKGLKTLFQTSAGWAPESTRIPGLVIDAVTRPIQILDIIPTGTTGMAAVVYMEETTRTHTSAERAENAAYAESAFALTQRSSTVRSIGTSIPVTDEQLEDVEGVRSYLDQRLVFGNRQRFDNQVLNGDGIAPNLTGILNTAGIQTQAKGTDNIPDAIHKAMRLVRVTGRAFPNATILHPNDWEAIRLLKTNDGIYIWGSPAQAGPMTIWGVPVIESDAIAENTGLTGDFANFCQMYERRGMEVMVGYVNDDFLDGRRTIRAGFRVAFVVYRAAAFATITGI